MQRSPYETIAEAIPTYAMSYFKLPSILCDEIEYSIPKLLWSSKKRS